MKYEYNDIIKLQLSDEALKLFIKSIYDEYAVDMGHYLTHGKQYKDMMKIVLSIAGTNSYKKRQEYMSAENIRDKAIAAMLGPTENHKQKILDLWIKAANTMSTFEKVMNDWDKV